MTLQIEGTTIPEQMGKVKFNDTNVQILKLNDVTIWQANISISKSGIRKRGTYNLWNELGSKAGIGSPTGRTWTFTFTSCHFSGDSTSGYAFDVGNFPENSHVVIIFDRCVIVGQGGQGGSSLLLAGSSQQRGQTFSHTRFIGDVHNGSHGGTAFRGGYQNKHMRVDVYLKSGTTLGAGGGGGGALIVSQWVGLPNGWPRGYVGLQSVSGSGGAGYGRGGDARVQGSSSVGAAIGAATNKQAGHAGTETGAGSKITIHQGSGIYATTYYSGAGGGLGRSGGAAAPQSGAKEGFQFWSVSHGGEAGYSFVKYGSNTDLRVRHESGSHLYNGKSVAGTHFQNL
ncbi:hypothetical protein [Vibrio breoganii]|uniref:hypothetical protein n=1 Tax=Vibrio breoganii TaxID=553239 RepID=UPI000C849A7D|nr:hypothetical protein [Vibrio breoganii]PMK30673.1 hypothetical protein BCU03_09665 [Vibrio breoganii]